MRRVSIVIVSFALMLIFTSSAFAKKEVRLWLRNSDGVSDPVNEGGGIGVTHSTYLWSQTYGNSDVVTQWVDQGYNVYYSTVSDPNFYVDCEQFKWGGVSHNPQPGDILVMTITDSYGNFLGEGETISITLDGSEEQNITGESAALPIELTAFYAEVDPSNVMLRWNTESEINSLGYNIHRSVNDSTNFVKINETLIQGAGTTTEPQKYSFVDHDVSFRNVYYYKLESVDTQGNREFHGSIRVEFGMNEKIVPTSFALRQNYPNPFNPSTEISFLTPRSSHVTIKVYNLIGQEIRELLNSEIDAGVHYVTWNGIDDNGSYVPAGIYILTMQAGEYRAAIKMSFIQ